MPLFNVVCVAPTGYKWLFQEGELVYSHACFKGAEHDCGGFALNGHDFSAFLSVAEFDCGPLFYFVRPVVWSPFVSLDGCIF